MTPVEMEQDPVTDWVLGWFAAQAQVPEEEIRGDMDANYFEKGWIDSFQFIRLLADIEDELGVRFEQDEFQDRAFATVGGLVEAIERRSGA